MKTVDKYQFNEDTPFYQHGINTYLATHTVLKKKFVVKIISFGTDRENQNNNYLTKECSILKKLTHDNVYRCHKLLKSKNNFYAVFDFIEGISLLQILKQEISFQNKATIFKQLIQLLLQLRSKNIATLNINPSNIIVQDNYKIVVKNFGLGKEFENDQKEKVVDTNKFGMGEYTPPQINQGRVYRNSDCYSLGVVVSVLFEKQFKKMDGFKQRINLSFDKFGINSSLSIQNLKRFALDLTKRSSKERPELKEALVIKMDFLTVQTQYQRPSLSKSNQKNKLKVSQQNQKKILNTSRSTSNITMSEQKGRQKIQTIDRLLQVILKKRGLTILLLKLSQAVLINKQSDINLAIELAFLLIKKATLTITQLAKLLSKGFNLQYLISQKQFQLFQKDQNFPHFLDLTNRQMKSTQQKFQTMLAQTKKMLQSSKNQKLQMQTRNQDVNKEYFRKVIAQFLLQLRLVNTDNYASQFQTDSIYHIYVISLISDFKTLQEIYDLFFTQEVMEIKEQPLYKQLFLLPKVKLVELIQKNVTKLYCQAQQSFDMSIKTTKTTKTFKTSKSNQ